MTWHSAFGALVCHYCGLAQSLGQCSRCGRSKPRLLGLGTEKVEVEAARLFPGANISRLDSDAVSGVRAIERILNRLAAGRIDILIGTQMLAKGHDFPGIGLVGVILADLSLNQPDFRAAERTFQLLTQVAGRAGRGESPGRVIIQTFNPDHYSLRASAEQDYLAFFEEEIKFREQLFYPPFSRLIQINVSGAKAERVKEAARFVARQARKSSTKLGSTNLAVLGPAPAPVVKVRNRYRFLVLIKIRTAAAGQALLDDLWPLVDGKPQIKGTTLLIDVDPMGMP
jgi:primosomal protein N' (replication factor Y)